MPIFTIKEDLFIYIRGTGLPVAVMRKKRVNWEIAEY